jgi:DNA-binding transcriptional regulator PaaX
MALRMSHEQYLRLLSERPSGALSSLPAAEAFQRWAVMERQAWLHAVSMDPLLPDALLPAGYLGKQAWERRVQQLSEASSQIHSFTLGESSLQRELQIPVAYATKLR